MSKPITLQQFTPDLALQGSGIFEKIRNRGTEALSKLSFPAKKDEDWRYLNLRKLSKIQFKISQTQESENQSIHHDWLSGYRLPECPNSTLIFLNGTFREDLSSFQLDSTGITMKRISQIGQDESLYSLVDSISPVEDDFFTAVHSSIVEDGIVLHVEKDHEIESPIHVLNIQSGNGETFISGFRVLIELEEGAKLTLIEEHVSTGDQDEYLSIPVIESFVRKNARLNHLRIQRENKSCYHFSRPVTHLSDHAEYHSYTIGLGAHLFRNEPRVIQEGEHVDFTVDGLILIDGNQISDTHSVMDHRYPHGNSHQLHKVVVNGEAHSIFNGKIFVRKDAQLIDSFQENRNLLISEDGLVNTKPQLEIFADDVRCSHGATIGQLDAEEVFYLQSRGMTEQKAKEVLTYAFALETIENIEVESVHTFLIDEVKEYTSRNMRLKTKA